MLSHWCLCPTLCNPMDCSLPGSSVQEISQARILEWVDISSSKDLVDPEMTLENGRLWNSLTQVLFPSFLYSGCLYLWRKGFPGDSSGKEPTCQCKRLKRHGFDPWVGKIPWRRKWQSIPVFLPGESHGQRSLVSHSPWDLEESDMTEATCMHACLSRPSTDWKFLLYQSCIECCGVLLHMIHIPTQCGRHSYPRSPLLKLRTFRHAKTSQGNRKSFPSKIGL